MSVIACDKVIWALMLDNVGYLSVLKHPQKLYGSIPNPTISYPTKHVHTRTYHRQALMLDNVLICPQAPEMEKRADAADASVLFFSLAVLICWLYTRKLAKKELCYLHCAISEY